MSREMDQNLKQNNLSNVSKRVNSILFTNYFETNKIPSFEGICSRILISFNGLAASIFVHSLKIFYSYLFMVEHHHSLASNDC